MRGSDPIRSRWASTSTTQALRRCSEVDSLVARLAGELGLRLTLIGKNRVPLYMNGRYVTTSSELDLLRRMPFGVRGKLEFAASMLNLRRRYGRLGGAGLNPTDGEQLELDARALEEVVRPSNPDAKALWDAMANAIADVPAAEASALLMAMAAPLQRRRAVR